MKTDLIIIGAGGLGTFHAYHALKAGKSVLLLERDQYPVSATVRNFGQAVTSGLSSEWFEYGYRATHIYNEIQSQFDISVRNNGSVYIASDPEEQQLIHELKQRMDDRDYHCEILSADQCLEKWPALERSYCKEGIYFPQEISLEPDQMIHRVLEFCRQSFPKFTYMSGVAVTACESNADGVLVTTADQKKYTADKVILCNGHEFKLLFSDLFRESGIVVSKLQMMRTVPMPEVKLEGNILTGLTIRRYESFEECPSYPFLSDKSEHSELKKWGIHILFKKAKDGSVIIGDSHEYAGVSNTDDLGFGINYSINELMLAEAEKIVSFNVRDIAASWAGFYSQHPQKNVVEYDLDDKIHIRTAIGGKGMTSGAGYAEHSIQKIFRLK